MMRLAPGQSVGRYEILDVLGQGGMSESYRARDVETGSIVVLKIPYANVIGDPATYTRYEREAEIGRLLIHPHIQRFLDTGRLDDSVAPYIVMEYVEGKALRSYLDEHAPLSPEQAVCLSLQLAEALECCHSHGVVHRDLKPENVLIAEDGQVKLLDFGIALLKGARRVTWSRLSSSVGTPDYMAPEQIRGERGDVRTDVYALGVMLFEMLTGSVPYEGDSPLAVMSQHVSAELPRARSRRPEIPVELDAIVAKATRRDPDERYPSMAEFRRDLEHHAEIDVSDYVWPEKSSSPIGFPSVGGFPRPLVSVALILLVFAVLALIGVVAQFAHQAQLGR